MTPAVGRHGDPMKAASGPQRGEEDFAFRRAKGARRYALPPVKRAAIDVFFSFPPGMSPEVVNREIAGKLIDRLQPYMKGDKQPALKNYYIWLWPGGGTIGSSRG